MIAVTARALITLFRVSGKPVPKDLVEAADYDASKPVISSLTHTTTERDLEKMRLDSRNEAVKARQAKRETELEQLVADIKLNDEDDAAADTLNSPGGTVMARGGSSSSSKSSNVITLTPWAIHDVVVDEITKHTSIVCPPSIDMKRKCVLDVIRYICSVIELVLKAEVYDSDEWEEHYVAPFLVDLLIVPPPTTEDTSNTTTTSDSASAASHANAAANSITRKILHRLRLMTGYKGSSGDSEEGDEGEDGIKHLADCQFSLGYGGMVLLRKTRLRLKRGSRYGLCGHNGCGKTTLLTAIAKGQVDGWPSANEVKSVLVAHDFAADGDETAAAKSILDVMSDDPNLAGLVARDVISTQLSSLGFTDLMLTMPVAALSGGWKMKLGLARAMLMKADILLLDEPTNHLDVTNVEWLVNYLTGLTNVTSLIVSHDTKFLDNVCDHIVHYEKKKLKTYKGNLSEFVKVKPEAMTYYTLSHAPTKFIFPRPGNLDGVNSKFKPVLRLKNVQFQYPGSERIALNNVSASCCLASRIAVIGANGAGKSTLIKGKKN